MSATQNLKDNWPTLIVAIIGSIILPLLVIRFSYATAQSKAIDDRFEKKVDKTEYYEKWNMHDAASAQQWQTVILMLDDLKRQNSELKADIRAINK